MGRRAADHTIAVPVLGEPIVLGTRVWRTVAKGSSSMAPLTLSHYCNVAVQTSPAIRSNQLTLGAKHDSAYTIRSEKETISPGNGHIPHEACRKETTRREKTKSIIIKRKNPESKMKKGVTFEEMESKKSQGASTNQPIKGGSPSRFSINNRATSRRTSHFTNGSVVDSEVMGGISSDVSEGEESPSDQKVSHRRALICSPGLGTHVSICSSCGKTQNPGPQCHPRTSAFLGSMSKPTSPLYSEKNMGVSQAHSFRQSESHGDRSVLHSMSSNLLSYLNMNTNKDWPLSLQPAQQNQVSNPTNHHAVKGEPSADTHINHNASTSALHTHSLIITGVEDGALSRGESSSSNDDTLPVQPQTTCFKHTAHEKPAATQETTSRKPPINTHFTSTHCNEKQPDQGNRLSHPGSQNSLQQPRKTPKPFETTLKPQMFSHGVGKAEISTQQSGKPPSDKDRDAHRECSNGTWLNHKSIVCLRFIPDVKHGTIVRPCANKEVTSSDASNIQLAIPNGLESDTHAKPTVCSQAKISIKAQSAAQICADTQAESSDAYFPSHTRTEPHAETHHTPMRPDTIPPKNTLPTKSTNQSSEFTRTTNADRTSPQGASTNEDPAHSHQPSKHPNDCLFSSGLNVSTLHKATLTTQTPGHPNPLTAFTTVPFCTEQHSRTSPEVKNKSRALCVHLNATPRQTQPEVVKHSVLSQLPNDTCESSALVVGPLRQIETHNRPGMKSITDTESQKQADIKATEPEIQLIYGSPHQRSIRPPNKPTPLSNHACRPAKPSSAPPRTPSFKKESEQMGNKSQTTRYQHLSHNPSLARHSQLMENNKTLQNSKLEVESLKLDQNEHCPLNHGHPPHAVHSPPPSPCCSLRDPKQRFETVEASLQSNRERVATLLNIIQDLEMSQALSEGRRCFQTGRDLSGCSVCQKAACAVYSVEYDFRQQERSFKKLFESLCPMIPDRQGHEESLSLFATLIQNHRLHQLNANIMSQNQSESRLQPQIISQVQCRIQTQSRIQTRPHTQFTSQIQAQIQSWPRLSSQNHTTRHIQTEPRSKSQYFFQAKIKRKKLCRKLFGWLPRKAHLK